MSRAPLNLGWALIAISLGGCMKHVSSPQPNRSQTTVYLARRIRTLDASRPIVEALAVRGDKIIAVGTRQEVVRQLPDAHLVELSSAVIVPGVQDAHAHLA